MTLLLIGPMWDCLTALFAGASFESQKFETLFIWKVDAALLIRNIEIFSMLFEKLIKRGKTRKVFATSSLKIVNPFVPNAPFLYPLKVSENLTVFLMFSGCRERVHWKQMG